MRLLALQPNYHVLRISCNCGRRLSLACGKRRGRIVGMEGFGKLSNNNEQDGPVTGVDRWLDEVYGHGARESFDYLWKKNPEWTLEQAVRGYEQDPTHHQTDFFRIQNLEAVAKYLVPKIEKKSGEPVDILDVGCSSGEEPYSLAIHLLDQGIKNFSIRGIDVTPEIIEEAREGKYEISFHHSKVTHEMFDRNYFVDTGERTRGMYSRTVASVGPELRERVSFDQCDILEAPYAGKFDVIVVNNVLIHYPAKSLDKIVSHALSSLRPGGFFVIEPLMYPRNQREREWLDPYIEWRTHIEEKYPLKEVATHSAWAGAEVKSQQYYQYLGSDQK